MSEENNDRKFDDEKILVKVERLLRLAAKNSSESEATLATSRAMELLAAHNLDMSMVDIEGAGSGKRAEESLNGGFYQFERDLWRAISELNFVWYWTQTKRVQRGNRGMINTHQHVFIGKVVNIAATKAMAGYLLQTVERITREQIKTTNAHLLSSWATSFRRGMAERIIEKVNRRRWEALDVEEKRQAEAVEKARQAGVSNVETALTLATVKEREYEGNYDFIHGKGAWVKKQARDLAWREERAKATAAAEAAYTKWAAEHTEEAAKEERKRNAEARRRSSRRTGYRYSVGSQFKGDWSAYSRGREAGESVGIDPQTEGSRSKGQLV